MLQGCTAHRLCERRGAEPARAPVQEWLFTFFGDRVSVLPDTYNWKPYWGHPQAGTWGKAPAVKILHIHGPKFQESLCVLKFLGTYGLTDASNATLLAKIKGWCKYERSQYSMQLLLDANKARARPALTPESVQARAQPVQRAAAAGRQHGAGLCPPR